MNVPRQHRFEFHEVTSCRLDLHLARVLPDLSRSQIRRLIDEGQVTVNGLAVKASRILRGGETVDIFVPPPQPTEALAEHIALTIIFEDDDIVVVDKPAGMVVHPAPGHRSGTLVNALLAHCGDLAGVGGAQRPGIVHRLDSGTTGLIIAAKNDAAHRALQAQFKKRSVEKTYLALVYGIPREREGTIDVPIGRDRLERKKISPRSASTRPARTRYRVAEAFEEFALLEIGLITGRTHQVRVHCAHIRHPLVGDELYGGNRWRGVLDRPLRAAAQKFPRPALHAWRLAFDHPRSGARISLEAPVPADLAGLIDRLRSRA